MSIAAGALSTPPTGTVTFLFSDIEGSTRLLERLGDRYGGVLQLHRDAMRRAFSKHGGVERGTEGDSFFVAFSDALEAVAAAAQATRNLAGAEWPEGVEVRARIGVHTGEGRLVDGDYVGLDVHRAARISAAAHGGQIAISQSTRILVERGLPGGLSLRDLGEHRLRDLPVPEHLYQVQVDGLPADFPPLKSLARTVANLPAQLSTILGREADVAAVKALLSESRLVTITGSGGVGKTRLAQEVAREVAASAAGDVAFVPLQALTQASLIAAEILRALHLDVQASRQPLDRLVEHLAARPTLLVLDNLEQLQGAGGIVRALLDGAPTLEVLVASQAALHVAGEQEFALRALAVADGTSTSGIDAGAAESAAVRLFVERARAVRADFALDPSNASAIVAICARLDGLPLAIELAAAQVKLLSPAAILERISRRLDSLASRRDDLPARQRTLRDTVAWSYELLGDSERRLFRRLALFAGGARLREIEALASAEPALPEAFEALATLVDRSLVSVRHGIAADDDRYVQLQTVRAFGRDLLQDAGEDSAVARRYAEIYCELARLAEPEFYGRSRRAWLDRLAEDHDNLRAALDELQSEGALNEALGMAADLWRFWQQRGNLVEARDRIDAVLAEAARSETAIDLAVLSRAEEALGSVLYWTRLDRRAPRPLYERALEHAIQSGDRRREAWARYNLAFVFDFTPAAQEEPPDLGRATALRTEALTTFRELDDRRGIADSLWALGGNALSIASDPARARGALGDALVAFEQLGNTAGMAWATMSLGMMDAVAGETDRAEDELLRAADLFTLDGDVAGEMVSLEALGAIAAIRGDDRTAVRFSAAAVEAARATGAEPPQIPPITAPVAEARARLTPADLRREEQLGVAIGARSILASVLEPWRARTGARPAP